MTINIPDETALRSRVVPLEGTHNFRDVGGYPTRDGGITRERVLFRSDALHDLDDDGRTRLDELDVRTVVDLRTDDERAARPDAVGGRTLVEHPIFLEVGPDIGPRNLPEVYDLMLDRYGDRLAGAVRALAAPGALPAVVHCTAGKDRTGVVVGLVLAAVGVPDEIVAADYAATALFLTPAFIEVLVGASQETEAAMMRSEAAFMTALLTRVETEHGGAAAYLRAHGVTDEELLRLRSALTETS
jgi:protein-tyrosine phosphatase